VDLCVWIVWRIVNFSRGSFVQRGNYASKPLSRLWGLILFMLFFVVFYGHRVIVENDVASREQTSSGRTDQCERRGKGNENWCHYSFPVGDDWYRGVSVTAPEVTFDQTVDVYYDSRNPRVNALVDFSKQSRKDMRFLYFFLVALVAIAAFTIWDRAPSPIAPNERTS
jgi:hypothetical protein